MKLLSRVEQFSKKDLDDLQMSMLRRRAERFSWVRTALGPLVGGALLLALVGDSSTWRRWILGTIAGVSILRAVGDLVARKRGRRLPPVGQRRRLPALGGLLPVVGGGFFIFATGGFDSPVLPFLLPMAFFIGTLAEPRVLAVLFASGAALIVLLAAISIGGWIPDLIPAVLGGGANVPQPPVLVIAKAASLVFMLAWAAAGASLVRYVFRQIAGDALDARDEVLNNHEAHIQELTALSGEIAHELKNPLANVKGLAVLLSRDVEGRAAERVGVLLHEVDRMDGILQEFLTFSRPLVPLNQESVDLKELCQTVVALHEGLAHSKGVTLEIVEQGPVQVDGDPRKLKQVLINLVQNALDASPRGTAVELVLVPEPDGGGRVEVRDRGPGLSAEVKAHLFEPGLTTKERGSGLGLALARGLARQHGGELSLENREDGGCVARLGLPPRVQSLPQPARCMA